MIKDIIIEQEGKVLDSEIEELRSTVGWDNNTGPFSVVSKHLYTYFTARKDGKLVGFIDVLCDGIANSEDAEWSCMILRICSCYLIYDMAFRQEIGVSIPIMPRGFPIDCVLVLEGTCLLRNRRQSSQ